MPPQPTPQQIARVEAFRTYIMGKNRTERNNAFVSIISAIRAALIQGQMIDYDVIEIETLVTRLLFHEIINTETSVNIDKWWKTIIVHGSWIDCFLNVIYSVMNS